MGKYYQNYHKHDSNSNIYLKDSPVTVNDYLEYYKSLDCPQIFSTVQHGWQSPYFRIYDDIEKFNKKNGTNIKFIFGTEAYWVKDRHENDKSNCHIILLAKNDNGRKAINKALSIANKDGFYYRPRLDLELLLGLPKDDIFVTTACVAFWNKYDDIDDIVLQFNEHFTDFYLEVQAHNTDKQREINRHIIDLSEAYNIPIIFGADSHYIYDHQTKDRDELLLSGGISYEDEDGWYMDCPSYEVAVQRLQEQGVLTDEQIETALQNTNKILDFEDIQLDRSLKVPVIKKYQHLSQDERNEVFKQTLRDEWKAQYKDINKAKFQEYIDEIKHDIDEIIACGMADYFILSYEVMKLGQEKYGGILTPTGRGSAVSMYINKLLRLTKVDRINSPVLMYPERFLTSTRVLESHTPPDIDNNVSDREPFIQAQRELLGDLGTYDLIALGTLHYKSAFKMYARAHNLDPQVANEVTKGIANYEQALKHAEDDDKDSVNIYDYVDKEAYGTLIEGCQKYRGIIDNIKGHPCFVGEELVKTPIGYTQIKDIQIGDFVLSHDNQYHKVVNTMVTTNNYDVYDLTIFGSSPIKVTGNHPFYVAQKNGYTKSVKNLQWKSVDALSKTDRVGVPVNNKSIIPQLDFVDAHNPNFWWCIGRYFGDGWRSHTIRKSGDKKGKKVKDVIICCNKNNDETSDITSHLDWCSFRVSENLTTNKIYVKSKGLYDWLAQFGDGASNKHLNDTILDLPTSLLESFLNGYISADGCYEPRSREFVFSTISKQLALGICSCVHKVYHMPCSLIQTRKDRIETIQNRTVNCKAQYKGSYHTTQRPNDNAFYYEGFIWCPVRKIVKEADTYDVYNLEVEDAHSYTVNNFAVHNCATIALNGDVESEIGIILCKSEATKREVLTAVIESGTIDSFGYLKQDYLIVDSIGLTYDIYKEVGIEPYTVNELMAKIDGDKKVWDIYANGYTMCVNQCEQPKSTQKVMKYKPQNIYELTQFIAGIRPSFQSMYKTFESRQHFDYGVKALDNLLQDEYCDSSFLLYQESLMRVLGFAGFPMSETYTIIKAISKKKDYIIKDAKPRFITNFAKAILDTGETDDKAQAHELAEKVWKIIEDAAAYGFNSAHAFCMAIDSITIAYLKAYYPMEFYKCVLQRYTDKGEKDKVAAIKKEMYERGFSMKPLAFGDDNREFSIDKENNQIIQTMASIKNISKVVPQQLYELGQEKFDDFIDLLYAIKEKTNLNKTDIDILIKLNFFQEFGNINQLLYAVELFNKYGTCKTVKKDKTTPTEVPIIRKHATKETDKQFGGLDNLAIIKDLFSTCDLTTTTAEQAAYQVKLLGYTDIRDKSSPYCLVVNTEKNKYGTPFVTLYCLASGNTKQFKANKKWFEQFPVESGDALKIALRTKDKKRKDADGKWYTDGTETILDGWTKI